MKLLVPHSSEWAAAIDRPPLGSILWLDPSGGVIGALEALERAADNPWIPVLVTGPEPVARAFRQRAPHPDLVIHTPMAQLAPVDARRYVSRSPAPPAGSLARWIAARCRIPGVERFLASLLSDSAGPAWATSACSRREFYRRAARLGPLRPGDWRRLSRLARQEGRGEITVEHLASKVGVGVKPLRRQLARLLGVRVGTYREIPGWAWVLEAALRRHNMLAASPPPDAASQAVRPRLAGHTDPMKASLHPESIPAPSTTAPHQSVPARR